MNEHLTKLYHEIDCRGRAALQAGQESIDPYLASNLADHRMGLTVLGHLPAHVCRNLEFSLQKLAQLEPQQYFYPAADMHVTIMDLLAARPGLQVTPATFKRYRQAVAELTVTTPAIHWQMKGLIVSPAAVMVKGFYSPELATLRQRLRSSLPAAGLALDERYPTFSGHVTLVRFRHRLTAPASVLQELTKAAELDYGRFWMHSVDLVVHDWYNHRLTFTARLPFAE